MVDLGTSSNVMPYSVCQKINNEPKKCDTQTMQLDISSFKVLGQLSNVLMRQSQSPPNH